MGDKVSGALSASDFTTANGVYVEAWVFEGRPGQQVSIDLVSEDFDSYLYVLGPGIAEPLTDDDSGGACHARVDFTVLDRGDFHVVASSTSFRQTGTYQLLASAEPRPVVEMSCGGIDGLALAALSTDGRELTWGEPMWGSLSAIEPTIGDGQPVQAWSLDVQAGERATIRLESDDFDAYLFVYGPGLSEALTDDDSGGSLNSELTVLFPESGTYMIGAGALYTGSTGSYSLTVTEPISLNELPTDGRFLSVGSDAIGELTGADPLLEGVPVQAWAFAARAGDFVTIELMSDDFDSQLYVAGPGLLAPLSDDDGGGGYNSLLDVSFPDAGVYHVIASSVGGGVGMFTLRAR